MKYPFNEALKKFHPFKDPGLFPNYRGAKCPVCKEIYDFLLETPCGDCYDVDHFVHETYRCLIEHYSGEPI